MTGLAVLLCACALFVSACGTSSRTSAPTGSRAPELTDIQQLQDAFDAHRNVPQLIVLLSPT